MNRDSSYFKRAKLMVRTLPTVATETCFGLKGGTAISFFHRDLSRLSVDIDLVYLPIGPREESLAAIAQGLNRIAEALKSQGLKVEAGKNAHGRVHKLFVSDRQGRIKIEPNDVLRGTVHPVEKRELSPLAEEVFEISVAMQILAVPDLYGGKLCAALDRQHPRDLFDVRLLMKSEGITDAIRRTFLVYLICHDRPMHELINPTRLDIKEVFEREFRGMTTNEIGVDELVETREIMIHQLFTGLSADERSFLISIKEGIPRWDLLPLDGIERLPGVQWKLANVKKMDKKKHAEQIKKLRGVLGV